MESSSACDRSDWLLVRAGAEPAAVEDAALAARGPWPREITIRDETAPGLLLPCPVDCLFWLGRISGAGDGAFSLMGLISSGRGRVGEPGGLIELGVSAFFHLVEVVDVSIGDGLGGRRLSEGLETGVL